MNERREPFADESAANAIRVLETFCDHAKIAFDRALANRVLGEAQRAIPGDGPITWARRLVEVGESVNLRVRSMECTLAEALDFVAQGTPVATCRQDPSGGVHWVLLTESRFRGVRQAAVTGEHGGGWVTRRQLQRRLGLQSAQDSLRWVVGQPALGCENASIRVEDHWGSGRSPLGRLFALIQAERKDVWVVFVFSLVVGLLALATPIAVESLVNTVAFGRFLQPVVVLASVLLVFLGFAAGIRALLTYIVEIIQRRLFVRVVEDLAYRLPRVRHEAWDGHHGPEMVNRFFEVVTVQKVAAGLLLDALNIVVQTFVGMAVLAFYHPFLLGFDIALLVAIVFITFGLGRGAVKTAINESAAKYRVAAWLEELAQHETAFRFYSGTQFALDRADHFAVDYLEARKRHFRILLRQMLFALGLQAIAATVLLGLGGWLVIKGQLTLGQLVASELIVTVIVGSFAKMGKHLESYYDLMASMDKLGKLFDLPVEEHDRLFHLRDDSPATLSVRSVSFGFDERDDVLRDVNLELPAGGHVAIVGPAACGKSVLMELICGLRHPTSGHVELDGIDLRELRPDSLREYMALVRSVEIFEGSIDDNVRLNRPHLSAVDVREALQAVDLLEELLQLREGLNTHLQTGGAPLSRGQTLRLMLARAIVGRPRLLLIDGLLDGLADRDLARVMDTLTGERTVWSLLIATGRKEIWRRCDQVVPLEHSPSGRGQGEGERFSTVTSR